MSADLMLLVEQ